MIETRDRALLERLLRRDAVWAGYGLGDLDDAPMRRARWFLSDAAGDALALLYDWGPLEGLDPCSRATPRESVVLIPYGRLDALRALLPALPLPARLDVHVRAEHAPALLPAIDDASGAALVPHRRLALAPADLRPAPPVAGLDVRRLTLDDVAAARARYAADYPGTWFDPARIEGGRYLGAFARADLVAIAGTHIVSATRRVAAVGDVVTSAAWRGRGVAAWLTGLLVADLAPVADLVVLNVEAANERGIRAYRRIGFGARHGHDLAHLEGHGLVRRPDERRADR